MKTPTLFQSLLSVAALTLGLSVTAQAQVSSQLENLGNNKSVNERVSRLENRTRVGIVQGRAVDRDWRFELGANYGPVAYGDPYVQTHSFGLGLNLHITPKFSVGAQYNTSVNSLNAEGKSRYDAVSNGVSDRAPQVSWPEESILGLVNWYMTYGKINMFDWRVVQFDIYSLAGYGQVKVATRYNGQDTSTSVGTWTAGGGVGFWLSQHVSTRFELRYQNYAAPLNNNESRDLNLVVANFGLGVLL